MSAKLPPIAVSGLIGVLAMGVFGCTGVGSSSMPTTGAARYEGSVQISATAVPAEARPMGVVEAHGPAHHFVKIVDQFRSEVAKVGGDYGKIDSMSTKHDIVSRTSSESYKCGESTCSRTVTRNVEVATTTVQGRAFRR